MSLITKLFNYVLLTCKKHNIDESHGLGHSMNVLNFAHCIYENEVRKNILLQNQEKIIYVSAILHDMCDNKYVDETYGITDINNFLDKKLSEEEICAVKNIISTMSYSKVKKNGFPDLGIYQHAYHIVREADLLTAYDFDRCMIYNMNKKEGNVYDAFCDAYSLFEKRVLKHNDDNLFLTDYGRIKSVELHSYSLNRMNNWKTIMKKPLL
jgi:HD superfamily phosphodiesterase